MLLVGFLMISLLGTLMCQHFIIIPEACYCYTSRKQKLFDRKYLYREELITLKKLILLGFWLQWRLRNLLCNTCSEYFSAKNFIWTFCIVVRCKRICAPFLFVISNYSILRTTFYESSLDVPVPPFALRKETNFITSNW